MQVPVVRLVTSPLAEFTLQMLDVALVKLTGKLELAVAATVVVPCKYRAGLLANVMVCGFA